MATLLGKEVKITNSKLIRWAAVNNVELKDLSTLNVVDMIGLVTASSELTEEEIDAAIDKDLSFLNEMAEVVSQSLEIKTSEKEVKQRASSNKKKR